MTGDPGEGLGFLGLYKSRKYPLSRAGTSAFSGILLFPGGPRQSQDEPAAKEELWYIFDQSTLTEAVKG